MRGYHIRLISTTPSTNRPPWIHASYHSVLAATLVVGLIYAGLLAWFIPLNGLWAGDQGVKLVQIESLLLNKFSDAALPYPSAALDPSGPFSPLPTMLTWAHG